MKWWDECLKFFQERGLPPEDVELRAKRRCAFLFLEARRSVGKQPGYPVAGEPGVTPKQVLEAEVRDLKDEIDKCSRHRDDFLRDVRANPHDGVSEQLAEEEQKEINKMLYKLKETMFVLRGQERLEKDADISAQIKKLTEERSGQDAIAPNEEPLPPRLEKGRRCDKIIKEVKRIKYFVVGNGKSMTEIQSEHPSFLVWKLVQNLTEEDQGTFNHPRTWGSAVGYAKNILSKDYGKSAHTITDWVKDYRRHIQDQTTRSVTPTTLNHPKSPRFSAKSPRYYPKKTMIQSSHGTLAPTFLEASKNRGWSTPTGRGGTGWDGHYALLAYRTRRSPPIRG